VARRAPTVDPLLTKLKSEVSSRLQRNPRIRAKHAARLEVNELAIEGMITDVASGAVFLRSDVLVEAGERGRLSLGKASGVPVRATFSRTASADEEAGMVLAFEPFDAESELRVLATILELIESAN
jgi:hypothetical protein